MPTRFKKLISSALLIALSLQFVVSPSYASDTEETFYYLHDHLGGIEAVLDEGGTTVERRDYLPYGNERLAVGETDEDYGFTGKELDNETGLMYYDQRYYDAEIGRFVQVDPWEGDIRDPQSLNKYTYTRNNPVRYVDPTGESWKEALKGYAVSVVSTINSQINTAKNYAKDLASDPVKTVGRTLTTAKNNVVETYESGAKLASSFKENPMQVTKDIATGLSIEINDFKALADYDKGVAVGSAVVIGTEIAIGAKIGSARKGSTASAISAEKSAASANQMKNLGHRQITPFRDAHYKAKQYGGSPEDYIKQSSQKSILSDGTSLETHSVKNIKTGRIYEQKTKIKKE